MLGTSQRSSFDNIYHIILRHYLPDSPSSLPDCCFFLLVNRDIRFFLSDLGVYGGKIYFVRLLSAKGSFLLYLLIILITLTLVRLGVVVVFISVGYTSSFLLLRSSYFDD